MEQKDLGISIFLLQHSTRLRTSGKGKQVHCQILKNLAKPSIVLGNTIINMYLKFGSIVDANYVFDRMPIRNKITWTTMIAEYCSLDSKEHAVKLFTRMQHEGVKPDKVAFLSVLKACALEEGKHVHAAILKIGCELDVVINSSLIDMYGKCGSIQDARKVFDGMIERDVVAWSAMIIGHAQHRNGEEALMLYKRMQHEGTKPDKVTFASVLAICADMQDLEHGKVVHQDVLKTGCGIDVFIGSSLVDMYAKCGRLHDARRVFDEMPKRNVVSWNAMIAAYVQHENAKEAICLFHQMQHEGFKPDKTTFPSILTAFASVAALEQGKKVHLDTQKTGCEQDIFVGSGLIDMYSKCGSISEAEELFERMPMRNIVSWNAIIAGHAQHGDGKRALKTFRKMQEAGMKADDITFISILHACSHVYLLDQGWQFFHLMIREHSIPPRMHHYACMVDLLCRMGSLHEAQELIYAMPFQPDGVVLTSLLGACRIQKMMDMGEQTIEHVLRLDGWNGSYLVALSNLYAEADERGDVKGE